MRNRQQVYVAVLLERLLAATGASRAVECQGTRFVHAWKYTLFGNDPIHECVQPYDRIAVHDDGRIYYGVCPHRILGYVVEEQG